MSKEFDNLVPEAPARCGNCGRSLWLADRDNNGSCDECWEKAEKITQEEVADRYRREVEERRLRHQRLRDRGLEF